MGIKQWFDKAEVEAEKKQEEEFKQFYPEAEKKEEEELRVGATSIYFRSGDLRYFGGLWLRLDQVSAVNFNPEDGCAAEIVLSNRQVIHVDEDDDADKLEEYLKENARGL